MTAHDHGRDVLAALLAETAQRQRVRRPARCRIEHAISRRLVTYFVSFADPVAMIDHDDADVIEEALRQLPADGRGLTLLLSAPGGDGLAAERIVRVCRAYARGDFEVIVPRMAKSAATMICFGANAIWMGETAELGPVDPQVGFLDEGRMARVSAREVIVSYEALLKRAESCPGNIEPYIQQLARYDARLIETYRTAEALSESITVKLLRLSMMAGRDETEIRERIRPFLDLTRTWSHARAIPAEDATACGLEVRVLPADSPLYADIWELYLRSAHAVDHGSHKKLVETRDQSFAFAARGPGPELVSEGP